MENLKQVDLEQKIETRFCAWNPDTKKLYTWIIFGGESGYRTGMTGVVPYRHDVTGKKIKVGAWPLNSIILPYSDNYVIKDGVLYEKSAYEPGTVGYWLDKLDEPERSQAFENMANFDCIIKNLHDECDSISDAIINSLTWKKTPQDYDYWEQLYDEYYRKENGL